MVMQEGIQPIPGQVQMLRNIFFRKPVSYMIHSMKEKGMDSDLFMRLAPIRQQLEILCTLPLLSYLARVRAVFMKTMTVF